MTGRDGEKRRLPALPGWRVMEVIRDAAQNDKALAIKAECGGALSCATCHVYVEKKWLDRLSPATAEEERMLDGAFGVTEQSRLSCQIIMDEALDGLEVALAPGSEP